MDDKLMMKYLRSEGIGMDISDQEFKEKIKEFMSSEKMNRNSYNFYRNSDESFPMYDEDMREIQRARGMSKSNTMRHNYPEDYLYDSDRRDKFFNRFNRMPDSAEYERMYRMMRNVENEHFDESYAKHLVSEMYHLENGRKHAGEKFSMTKAKEIYERYRGIIPASTTSADIYVAINSHYHDYCGLFKTWFGDNIDQKIIESAIIFWFKDDDCKGDSKLMKFFNEY